MILKPENKNLSILATNTTTNDSDFSSSNRYLFSTLSQIAIIYCNLVHIAYFILVYLCPELRTKPLTFVNHAVIANMLLPLGALVFEYDNVYKIPEHAFYYLCPIFEIFWPISIFIRTFSILLIAVHRYIAVFQMNLFNRIKSSTSFYACGILAAWAASIGLSYLNKTMFNTSYVPIYCSAGLSPIWARRLGYALFKAVFALFLPTFLIVFIYLKIIRKLSSTQTKLANFSNPDESANILKSNATSDELSVCRRSPSVCRKREAKFAKQFILMTVVIVLTFLGVGFLSMRNLWRHHFSMYSLRLAVRAYSAIMSSFIPILSVYFNPSRKRFFDFVKSSTSANDGGSQT